MRAAAAAPFLLLLTSPVAVAATIHVPGDQPTIQAGIDAAAAGDTVLVACGTYYEYGVQLVSGVTLRSSSGSPDCVTIDGQSQGRILEGTGINNTTLISGLTLTRGNASGPWPDDMGGGLFCDDGSPRIIDCRFQGNSATTGGGAAFRFDCSPEIERCVFEDNVASGYGGALGFWATTPALMVDCTFASNSSSGVGGAVFGVSSPVTFASCDFESNSAPVSGGAVCLNHCIPTFTGCTFISNSGRDGGALYFIDSQGPPVIDKCLLQHNTAEQGGAIFWWLSGPAGIIRNCRLIENDATGGHSEGGGVFIGASEVSIFGVNFWRNTAGVGGAVWVHRANIAVTSCTFVENGAPLAGAVHSQVESSTVITKTIIASSTAGGAVDCDATGKLVVLCSDLSDNAGGDWVGCVAGQGGVNGNFSADPLFCDPEGGDFTLSSQSPCLPGNHPDGADCGLIGALDQGCGTVSVEQETWAGIKSRYISSRTGGGP